MKHFLLIYEADSDSAEKRAPHRAAHLELAKAAAARGELLVAGALVDPIDSSVFLFHGEGPQAAVSFAESDPYVTQGVVRSWRVREWATVVGPWAANPV
ncbi:MAG: YciI-like protein [Caulobacterales bacterium]